MARFPVLSALVFTAALACWWDAWCEMWDPIGMEATKAWSPRSTEEFLQRRFELDAVRSQDSDALDADVLGGGDFEGAGTGGQD